MYPGKNTYIKRPKSNRHKSIDLTAIDLQINRPSTKWPKCSFSMLYILSNKLLLITFNKVGNKIGYIRQIQIQIKFKLFIEEDEA